MVRLLLNTAALMIAAWPMAAAAQPGTMLDCAVDRADPGLRRSLAGALIGDGDDAAFDALLGRFSTIADGCTASLTPDDERKKAYLDYGLSRVLREWLAGELAGFGLSAATIDDSLGLGEGRPNPILRGQMSEDQVKTLVQALIEGGIDAENLSPPAWNSVGTYAAASSLYWRRRARVSAWALGPAPSPAIAVVAAPVEAAPEQAGTAVPAPPISAPEPTPSEPATAPQPAASEPMTAPTDVASASSPPLAEPEPEPASTAPAIADPVAADPIPPEPAMPVRPRSANVLPRLKNSPAR